MDSLPADPQGKLENTGVGSLSFLQGIFLTQELNQGLLHCRWILYQLSYQRSHLLSKYVPISAIFSTSGWWPHYLSSGELLPFWPPTLLFPRAVRMILLNPTQTMSWSFLNAFKGFSLNLRIKFKLWSMTGLLLASLHWTSSTQTTPCLFPHSPSKMPRSFALQGFCACIILLLMGYFQEFVNLDFYCLLCLRSKVATSKSGCLAFFAVIVYDLSVLFFHLLI